MIASLVLGRYQILLTSCQEYVRKGLKKRGRVRAKKLLPSWLRRSLAGATGAQHIVSGGCEVTARVVNITTTYAKRKFEYNRFLYFGFARRCVEDLFFTSENLS